MLWNSPLKSAAKSEEMMVVGSEELVLLVSWKKASLPTSPWLVFAELQKQRRFRALQTYGLAQIYPVTQMGFNLGLFPLDRALSLGRAGISIQTRAK